LPNLNPDWFNISGTSETKISVKIISSCLSPYSRCLVNLPSFSRVMARKTKRTLLCDCPEMLKLQHWTITEDIAGTDFAGMDNDGVSRGGGQ